jgi:hypothetical protein
MTDLVPRVHATDHWLQVATASAGAMIIGVLSWLAVQLVGMRDDIHSLKDDLPSIEKRVDRLEARQDAVVQALTNRQPADLR